MQQRNVNDSNTKTGTAHYCAHAKPFCEERRAAGVELSGGMENGKPRITWVTDGTWLKKDVTCSMGFWVQVALGTSVLTGPTRQIPSRYVDHKQPRQTNNCSLNDCPLLVGPFPRSYSVLQWWSMGFCRDPQYQFCTYIQNGF